MVSWSLLSSQYVDWIEEICQRDLLITEIIGLNLKSISAGFIAVRRREALAQSIEGKYTFISEAAVQDLN